MFEGLRKSAERTRRALQIGRLASEAERTGTPLTISFNRHNGPVTITVGQTSHISPGENEKGPDRVITAALDELQNGGGTNYPLTRIVK